MITTKKPVMSEESNATDSTSTDVHNSLRSSADQRQIALCNINGLSVI